MDLPSTIGVIDGENPLILPSAHRERKHGEPHIPDEDILHVYRHGIQVDVNTTRIPPTHILVGTGCTGAVLYEIGVVERSWIPEATEHVIVHAMRARLNYEMLWVALQQREDGGHHGL